MIDKSELIAYDDRWRVKAFPSGTVVVTQRICRAFKYGESSVVPWLYVFGPVGETESDTARNRSHIAEEIAQWMNREICRPAWLSDLERSDEGSASSPDGTKIIATGPMVDRDPPRCDWREDKSEAAKDARARLMDQVFGIGEADAKV